MAEGVATFAACAQCGTHLAPGALVCPGCSALVHAADLKRLSSSAELSTQAGDLASALSAWRQALTLLPRDSRQYAAIIERIGKLSRHVDAGSQPQPDQPQAIKPSRGPLAAVGALTLAALSKFKLLLLGLTKASTFLSMFLTFGVYWSMFGWRWAAGIVVTTYIHEMGHVFALRSYGIPATAPMFIPGFGAYVRLQQAPVSVVEDSRIGLAGPVWGTAAAFTCAAVGYFGGWPAFMAAGRVAAWINLFNLLPVWQLDGARGFKALSRNYRWMAAATALIAAWQLEDGMLLAVGAVGVFRAFGKDAPQEGDTTALATYVGIVLLLSGLLAAMAGLVPGT